MAKKCVKVAGSAKMKAHVRCYNISDTPKAKSKPRASGGGGGSATETTSVGSTPERSKTNVPQHNPKDYESSVNAFKDFATEKEQIEAIQYYTGNGYMSLNLCRRKNQECNKVDYAKANKLQKTLIDAPKYQGTVYRGTSFDSKEDLEAHIGKLKVGGILEDKGFMSTSIKEGTANLFDFGDNSVRYKIKSKNGVSVKAHSKARSEEEVLFPANSKHTVKKITKKGNTYIIEMENID